ncbi:SNF1-related protein kinase regulatory subunit beta-2 [Ziziphus jujuba]|uniref:SNF1-related protein kinase regulatory subunit beta-2 n=1 Tax=Ziziphus jujuba TaxID=326968 RepID=A0A6P4BDE1_ZIZJJ|nr:SNF1-related protein kinase regulatory subunit beta-2 [Ziziphus jujuba]
MVMGNASGRKDGEGPSGTKSYEENYDGYDLVFPEPMAMAHSPPHSPRAFQPPLLFTLPNPVVPQPRPGEAIQAQTQAYFGHTMHGDDTVNERLKRVKLSWNHGGKQVAVTGSWDNWETRDLLLGTGDAFYIEKLLPSGIYQFRFIVDGYLRCAPDLPWFSDSSGNAYNILDLQEHVSELPENLSEFESPPSPPSSYDNKCLSEDDFSKPPPETPPQLQSTILNEPSSSYDAHQPQCSELNHLYIQTHNEGRFMALGSTYRFREKYVTMILYKPLKRKN